MALKFYQNYIDSLSYASPDEAYRDLMQASVLAQWDNTTQVINIKEQDGIGSSVYKDIEVRVDYAIDMGTGFKQDDDFKIFAFKDINHKSPKGLMYQYDDDYWIVINTSELGSITSDITVRRCNNVMRWVDKDSGYIYEYPCIIEYVLESPQQLKDKDVITSNGHITIICQGDNITRHIEKNTRFIFNKQPFKLIAYQNMLNEGVKDNMASDLLYLDMYLDMEEPDDDLVNNIANRYLYNYAISLNAVQSQIKGFIGKVIPTVTLNGEIVKREVQYSSNENVTVENDGTFTLIGEVGSKAIICGSIKGNENLVAKVEIDIVEEINDIYELVITPEFNTLKVGKSKEFSVDLYKNGVKQDEIVDYNVSRLSSDYFKLTRNNNVFTLFALQISTTPLNIVFSAMNVEKTIEVTFTSLF